MPRTTGTLHFHSAYVPQNDLHFPYNSACLKMPCNYLVLPGSGPGEQRSTLFHPCPCMILLSTVYVPSSLVTISVYKLHVVLGQLLFLKDFQVITGSMGHNSPLANCTVLMVNVLSMARVLGIHFGIHVGWSVWEN